MLNKTSAEALTNRFLLTFKAVSMRNCDGTAVVPHFLPSVLVIAIALCAIVGITIAYVCAEAKRQKVNS